MTATAQTNLDFEAQTLTPWIVEDENDDVALDAAAAYGGRHSLRLRRTEDGGVARAEQTLPASAIAGNRLRIHAYVKAEDVADGYAGLWVSVEGPHGLLYVDQMRDRGVRGTSEWTQQTIDAPIPEETETIAFGPILRGRGAAWFDDFSFETLNTAALPPASRQASAYLHRALSIMREHSVRRDLVDWARLEAAAMEQARGARTAADSYIAVRLALRGLGDGHSFLMGARRRAQLEEGLLTSSGDGGARSGDTRRPRGEALAGGVGYVWVPGFTSTAQTEQRAFADRLQEILRELDPRVSCGWLVDLRRNTGGNVWPMLAGIGPLLGEGPVAAVHYADGSRVPMWYRDGQAGLGDFAQLTVGAEPYRSSKARLPVAVLIGEDTASSGEAIAVAFRGRPDARSFGAATRGLSTGNRSFPLSDGAALVLTVATTADRTGRVYGGAIEPDQTVADVGARVPLPEQAPVHAGLEWLTRHGQCAQGEGAVPPYASAAF